MPQYSELRAGAAGPSATHSRRACHLRATSLLSVRVDTRTTPVAPSVIAIRAPAVAGCPAPRTATPRTAAPPAAAATATPLPPGASDSLDRARALLFPYDVAGTSRDAVEMLLRLAK